MTREVTYVLGKNTMLKRMTQKYKGTKCNKHKNVFFSFLSNSIGTELGLGSRNITPYTSYIPLVKIIPLTIQGKLYYISTQIRGSRSAKVSALQKSKWLENSALNDYPDQMQNSWTKVDHVWWHLKYDSDVKVNQESKT